MITVITINYNNAQGLRKTLSSVCAQSYTGFEYIVIDGGSNDGSADAIAAFADKIDYSVSERDGGIYNAMNKGIARATGKYLLFVNSGDTLSDSEALQRAAPYLAGDTEIVYFDLRLIYPDRRHTWVPPDRLSFEHFVESSLPHPASFISKKLFDKVGLYDEELRICADWKFFLDAICKHNATYKHVPGVISEFAMDGISSDKAQAEKLRNERDKVLNQGYAGFLGNYTENQKNREIVGKLKTSRLFGLMKKAGLFAYIDI